MTSLIAFGPAVHGHPLGFGAQGLPERAAVVFESPDGRLLDKLRPDLVRPSWLLLERLPTSIPLGRCEVFVEGEPGWKSSRIPVDVSAVSRSPTRVLYPGRQAEQPFTIAFVANPAIKNVRGEIVRDPVLAQLPRFFETMMRSLKSLLTLDEDLLRRDGLETLIRFVVVVDPDAPVTDQNALAEEYAHLPVMTPRRLAAAAFLRHRGVAADVGFVVHGSTSHQLASAQFTTDDRSTKRLEYTYDGHKRVHGLFPAVPGSVALSIDLNHALPIALHEFAHAVSECDTGRLIDAYVDGGDHPEIILNKKYREQSGDPVPPQFGTYGAGSGPPGCYQSALARGHLKYPPSWTSYHPEPLDPREPNLLDDYRQARVNSARCRFDRLTYDWLRDRLWAKANR